MDECKVRAPGSLDWEGQTPMTEREKQHLIRCAIAFVRKPELLVVGEENRVSLARKLQVMLAEDTPVEKDGELRAAVETFFRCFDSSIRFTEHFETACENLRAAYDKTNPAHK